MPFIIKMAFFYQFVYPKIFDDIDLINAYFGINLHINPKVFDGDVPAFNQFYKLYLIAIRNKPRPIKIQIRDTLNAFIRHYIYKWNPHKIGLDVAQLGFFKWEKRYPIKCET
jgi:hypothetical protein